MPSSTPINIPGLTSGLTVSTRVFDASDLSTLLETVTLTESSGRYSGTVTGALDGLHCFEVLYSGNVVGKEFRTIHDDTSTYTISSELEYLDSISSSTDSGPLAVTITIMDDSNNSPILGASVRLANYPEDFIKTTTSSGAAVFGLTASTYNVTVTRVGYTAHVGTLTITDTTPQTIQLTPSGVISPPANPMLSTGVIVTYDEFGVAESNVPVTVTLTAGPGTAGYAHDTKPRTGISDGSGIVQWPFVRGATYSIYRGAAPGSDASSFGSRSPEKSSTFTVPDAGSFSIAEIIGKDAE